MHFLVVIRQLLQAIERSDGLSLRKGKTLAETIVLLCHRRRRRGSQYTILNITIMVVAAISILRGNRVYFVYVYA